MPLGPKKSLDGFRPVTSNRSAVRASRPTGNLPNPPVRRALDSRPKPTPRPVSSAQKWQYNARKSQLRSQRTTTTQPNKRTRFTVPVLVIVLIASGAVFRFAAASEIFIGVYAVVAFMRHIESRTTFALALSSLACVILLLLVWPAHALTETFAEYAFLLCIVGTISLIIETRRLGSRLAP